MTKKTFGADTLEAVKRFQAQAALTVGVIGKETWAALIGDTATIAEPVVKGTVSAKAKAVCALSLTRIGDLYVWGASALTDLSDMEIKAMDDEFVRAIKFRDSQHKAGLAELMAHDCSGFISWLMRETGNWDDRKNCDGLWALCDAVARNELIAGDFLFRNSTSNANDETHMGLYMSRGMVIHAKGRDVGVVLEGLNQGGSG